jgi:hypothetical protein
MEQPIPTYEQGDLERVVLRDYGSSLSEEAKLVLARYGWKDWQREPLRVKMACLKLANGSIGELKKHVEVACDDYRDVFMLAEYPAYMKAKDIVEKYKAIASDWEDLQAWLHKA